MTNTALSIRPANAEDVPALIALYADDDLGRTREGPQPDGLDAYRAAFDTIDAHPDHILAVGEIDGEIVATLLLSFLPGMSRRGARRAQIESMRVSGRRRNQGLGQALLDWAIATARENGCSLAQLTSDMQRADAHRFYTRAGFSPSHVGFKLRL